MPYHDIDSPKVKQKPLDSKLGQQSLPVITGLIMIGSWNGITRKQEEVCYEATVGRDK